MIIESSNFQDYLKLLFDLTKSENDSIQEHAILTFSSLVSLSPESFKDYISALASLATSSFQQSKTIQPKLAALELTSQVVGELVKTHEGLKPFKEILTLSINV